MSASGKKAGSSERKEVIMKLQLTVGIEVPMEALHIEGANTEKEVVETMQRDIDSGEMSLVGALCWSHNRDLSSPKLVVVEETTEEKDEVQS